MNTMVDEEYLKWAGETIKDGAKLAEQQLALLKHNIEWARNAEAEATRLRGLVDLVNKYAKTRDIADRKAMFALAKALVSEGGVER